MSPGMLSELPSPFGGCTPEEAGTEVWMHVPSDVASKKHVVHVFHDLYERDTLSDSAQR